MSASHRFDNSLRYRDEDHPQQTQLTPEYVLAPVREALGGIDLDPCTTADNPPYGKARERWAERCEKAAVDGSRVILLMPSHTDTRLFQRIVGQASHVVFVKGRVKFGVLRPNRRQVAASHPSCLVCWNVEDARPLARLGAVWYRDADSGPPAHNHTPHDGAA